MAVINELITLGIGTPSSIPHFLLLGLFPLGEGDTEPVLPVEMVSSIDAFVTLEVAAAPRIIYVLRKHS